MEHRTQGRPRLLLADDHTAFLERVSRFLAADFEILALAGDGRQALDLALRLNPDLVLLDVAMPELDGFQVLQALRLQRPEIKVVFMTMHRDDAFVAAALQAGADAYVLKSRIFQDLTVALEHALAGRLFVPSLTSLSAVAGASHTVQCHGNDDQFVNDVTELVVTTLRSGEPVVIVASDETRTRVAQRLQAQHMNLAVFAEQGQYVEEDSALALSHVMEHGRPEKRRLVDMLHRLDRLRLAAPNGLQERLTIFGDMTVALCRTGRFEAALEIERLWHELTQSLPFLTICSYPTECFQHAGGRDQLSRLCAQHRAATC
jgi:two-component system response regulator NreC